LEKWNISVKLSEFFHEERTFFRRFNRCMLCYQVAVQAANYNLLTLILLDIKSRWQHWICWNNLYIICIVNLVEIWVGWYYDEIYIFGSLRGRRFFTFFTGKEIIFGDSCISSQNVTLINIRNKQWKLTWYEYVGKTCCCITLKILASLITWSYVVKLIPGKYLLTLPQML
jgi:hypothetical protein